MLRTVFNAEDGLSEDVAIRLYQRAASSSGKLAALKEELQIAFEDEEVSWKNILWNDDYEVYDARDEKEAREFARRILWKPLVDGKKGTI
jgi:hypothetical protein